MTLRPAAIPTSLEAPPFVETVLAEELATFLDEPPISVRAEVTPLAPFEDDLPADLFRVALHSSGILTTVESPGAA